MSGELALVLLLLAAAIAMFALNKPRMDAVALLMLVVLPFTGSVTVNEALAGFSDPNIVLIAALFVIGEGLVRTGVARSLGDWLTRKAGGSETRLLVLLMVVVCGLGATMSSTAVTAIFIPVVLRISQGLKTSPSRLMMPLSFAALISGMTTLIATAPNLVVNSELVRHLQSTGQADATGFRFFSFTPFGAPVLVLGIVYMLFARRWLNSDDATANEKQGLRPSLQDLITEYRLADREVRVQIRTGSPLVGKTLAELRRGDVSGAILVAIERAAKLIQPNDDVELRAGDILFVDLSAPDADVDAMRRQYDVEMLPISGSYFTDRSQQIGMAEVIVPATAEFVGKSVNEADFRNRYGLTVVGLRRGSESFDQGLRDIDLRSGDTLLMIGPWRNISRLRSDTRDLVVLDLPAEFDELLPAAGKAPQAIACLLLAVGLMVSGVIPNVQAALIGCLLMGLLGCIDLTSAYRSIDWKTIVLIVGMLPFSIALDRTGGVDLAADGLMTLVGGAGPHVILATLFAITALLGMFISNTATAVLMAPVAISVADELQFSPYPFAMIVAIAASTAFMTPVSSPVNTLVVTPGNYTFGDFAKLGIPFSLIVLIVSVILVPILLPL
jgi:di/tricarboxylate transporter